MHLPPNGTQYNGPAFPPILTRNLACSWRLSLDAGMGSVGDSGIWLAQLSPERQTLQTLMEDAPVQLAYLDPRFDLVWVKAAYAEGSGQAQIPCRRPGWRRSQCM
jgi:hypothetical protein